MKTASFDEIVFRDRNKNYGAYELRKRYDRTVIISFLVALFIVSGMAGIPMVDQPEAKIMDLLHDGDIVKVDADSGFIEIKYA